LAGDQTLQETPVTPTSPRAPRTENAERFPEEVATEHRPVWSKKGVISITVFGVACIFLSNGLYLLGKAVPLLSGFTAHDSSGRKVNIFMVAKLPVALV
jgi:hypothetical protein